MNKSQSRMLEKEYKHNPDWSPTKIKALSKKISRETEKIYKWHWERKKKIPKGNNKNKK